MSTLCFDGELRKENTFRGVLDDFMSIMGILIID